MYLPQRLFKLGFFLLYNQLAFTYDFIAWVVSLGQWADWRRSALAHLQPGLTLELAYGTGGFYLDMIRAGLTPVGIDLSPFMARLTAKRLDQAQRASAILRAKAQALPFPDGTFTNAVATFPTNYIFEPETLAEIHRILIDQPHQPARLVIVMQGRLKGPGPVNRFIDWLYEITGQHRTIVAEPLERFVAAGFQANWQIGQYRAATATLIVAQKTLPDQPEHN